MGNADTYRKVLNNIFEDKKLTNEQKWQLFDTETQRRRDVYEKTARDISQDKTLSFEKRIDSTFDLAEEIYEPVKNKFNSLRQSSDIGNPELQNRLKEIGSIIYAQSTQQTITSTATQSFNVMMENIRECLSCIASSGANNDTDLTFGDINKFYRQRWYNARI